MIGLSGKGGNGEVAISGKRFEWLSIPTPERPDDGCLKSASDAFIAKTCPDCGWVDGDQRFEAISGQQGIRECWRCGSRWDLSAEIRKFFMDESITLPPVKVWTENNFNKFYKTDENNDERLFDLHIQAAEFCLQKGFEQLVSLNKVRIDRMAHQLKTARTVLKKMRGRALLADEVGMGKTIEAGIVIKELLVRDIVKKVLILAPAGLTGQWQDELQEKFGESFEIFSGSRLEGDTHRLIMSYDTARRREVLKTISFDLIILDEADRLRTRTTELNK